MHFNLIEPPETMDINSKHGDKIVYLFPGNGTKYNQEMCSELLNYKMVYTVDEILVGRSMTHVKLIEFGDQWFNSVMFDNYQTILYSPNNEHEKDIVKEYRAKITELKEKADMYDNLCK